METLPKTLHIPNLSELYTKTLERLKAHAAAKGVMPEALTTTPEVTQRFMSLVANYLI